MGNAPSGDVQDGTWQRRAPYEVRIAATEILKVAGVSGYHTSIMVDDREYFFDSLGIMAAPPLWSHIAGRVKQPGDERDVRTEVIDVGRSSSSGKALVQALRPFFEKGSYDIFYKNCNTFTDVALYFLTKTRLKGRFNRIERLITATNPLSTGLLNRVFRACVESSTGQSCEVDVYVQNPEAQGFSVDDAIASLDESDSDSDSSEDSADSDVSARMSCNIMKPTQCCRPEARKIW
jgi:hypothetical protein